MYSHYSFDAASQASSGRKRPRRLRVKKYVEKFEHHHTGNNVSSVDMTGEIKDAILDYTDPVDGKSASNSTQNDWSDQQSSTLPPAADNSTQHAQKFSKPRPIGRIRHQYYPSASTHVGVISSATFNGNSPKNMTVSDESSSDDEPIIHGHMDGSFPSIDVTNIVSNAINTVGQRGRPIPESEVESSEISYQTLRGTSSDQQQGTTETGTQSLPLQQHHSINTSATSSDDAWDRVVEAQSDTNTSQDESVSSTPTSSWNNHDASTTVSSSSAFLPLGQSTASVYDESRLKSKDITTRYETYRASLGRNFYQYREEKPWAAITAAALSTITVDRPTPDADPIQDADIGAFSSPCRLSVHGGGSSEGSPSIYQDTSFDNEYQTYGFGQDVVNLHETPVDEINNHYNHDSIIIEGDNEEEELHCDEDDSSTDDDGGFPSTAAMLAFARANTPPASPNLSNRLCKVAVNEEEEEKEEDVNSSEEDSCEECVEEIEVEMVDDKNEIEEEHEPAEVEESVNYHQVQFDRSSRILNEKDELTEAALQGVATAALMQRGKLSESSQVESSYRPQNDSEPRQLVELKPLKDRNPRSIEKAESHLSRRSKKFQLYTQSGIYIHSSDSLSVSSTSSTAEASAPIISKPKKESLYDQHTSSAWRKKLGALFSWRYTEPRTNKEKDPRRSSWAGDEEKAEVEARGYYSDDNISLAADFEPLKMFNEDEEDQKKKMARILASAALFKKDDLAHVEEEDKVKHKSDQNDPKSLQSSLAAAAAVLAAKRKDRLGPMDEEDIDKLYQKEKDAKGEVTQGSLAAQVAALARKNAKLRSPDDYDKLYRKPPPEKKEPQLMIQLRPVRKEPSPEEDLSESSEDFAPKLMVQLKPVSRRFDENTPDNILQRQPLSPVIKKKSVSVEDHQPEEGHYETVTISKRQLKNYPWPQWGVNRSKESEAYEAFSEASSYDSSLTNLDPVNYKETISQLTRTRRYCLRFIFLILLLAAIALPLYFLVFADGNSKSDGIGGIFPPIATLAPTAWPSSPPTIFLSNTPTKVPSISPSPTESASRAPTTISASPSLRPSSPPSQQVTVRPTLRPETPPSSPSSSLVELLLSVWPPLGDYLNDPDAESLPQVQAVKWLSADPNLDGYTEQQIIQRYAMATFFYSTGGQDWIENEGWLSDENECLWYTSASEFRVPCDDSGNLVYLELRNNGFSGTLPAELALLSNSLTRLELSAGGNGEGGSDSRLGGSFPSELGLLTLLEYVSINNHEISGALPTQIGLLSLLTVFDVEGNRFSGTLPTTVGQMERLNNLYMAFNRISGGIPSELGELQLLVNLDLYGNQLSSTLPWQLGNLPILQTLSLGYNSIEGTIPTQYGQLTNLQGSIDLSSNLLVGTIPTELGQLIQMSNTLNLSLNQLTGPLPDELGRVYNLSALFLQSNFLTGSIPLAYSNFRQMEKLRLENNDLIGTVPPFVCKTLVFDRIFQNPTFFITDCITEVACPCCQYCCEDTAGCECQFANTEDSFLCLTNEGELDTGRVIHIP